MIESFATGTYDVKRPSADGTYVNGEYQKGSTTALQVTGSLQPLTPRESALLPENERNREAFKFYSEVELFPATEDGLRQADIVEINDESFLVRSCERWRDVDLPYFKSILLRMNEQPEPPEEEEEQP